jgi:hypothetical protein
MQRHTFADQRMKRLVKLGWFHDWILSDEEEWISGSQRPWTIIWTQGT